MKKEKQCIFNNFNVKTRDRYTKVYPDQIITNKHNEFIFNNYVVIKTCLERPFIQSISI